ncbi:MAG: peptidoglycan bridge formation glycyltransferase FemA/FemB family protein [Clostridia bacterium]|nr:peptidoglycan bridge formation glycyltransferase FemA/FemB family protein [Clostridia bacterium]
MFEIITNETLEEYEAFVESHKKGHFLQSHKWSRLKSSWQWKAVAVRGADGKICGGMSLLIRKMPVLPTTLMYSPRGPVCDVHDRETLRALTEGAMAVAKQCRAYTFKLDPDVLSSDSEFISIMEELGYKRAAESKNFEGIQPNYVFRLNVKDRTEEEILAAFHQKTRYNLRLSVKKGVQVRVCGKEMLADFSRIMLETGTRDGFVTRPQSYFESLMDTFGEQARLYMAFWEEQPIAGTLAINYGNKVWYLYGASSNQHRNVMPNYQLQWEMIRWAVETGADIYDFRGVTGDLSPENPLYGLYLFKKGFSGDFCEFCGELEMVCSKPLSFAIDHGMSLMRNVRRRIILRRNKGK